jgi:uncharacterized small protein (DUF1192 family)
MSGENMVVTIQVLATIDTSNLKDKISKMRESEGTENYKEIQSQLAALQKELSALKAERQKETASGTKAPHQDGQGKAQGYCQENDGAGIRGER